MLFGIRSFFRQASRLFFSKEKPKKRKQAKNVGRQAKCYKSRRVGCKADHYAHEEKRNNISLAALLVGYFEKTMEHLPLSDSIEHTIGTGTVYIVLLKIHQGY